MDDAVARPRPDTRGAGTEYWRAGTRGVLRLPKCSSCGLLHWYPRIRCPHCGSADLGWIDASGRGVVHTFTVVRQSNDKFFKSRVPYVLAMVDLDEGVRLMSNIVDCGVTDVRVGSPVTAVFETLADDVSVPLFKLAGSSR